MFSIFISEYLMSISLSEFSTKIQNLKLNALIMVITAMQLSVRDTCSPFPRRLSADILSTSQQTDQTLLGYVLPDDCWITLAGALDGWWLSVLERARWWSSKHRARAAPCCGKDQFSKCSVHSYAHGLLCMAYVEFPMRWIEAVFEQPHQRTAVSVLTRRNIVCKYVLEFM